MDDEQEVRITLRLPQALRDGLSDASKASQRSMNGEIVDRLHKSFEHDLVVQRLLGDVARAEEFSASDTGLVHFRIPSSLVAALASRAESKAKSMPSELRDIVRAALAADDEPNQIELEQLKRKVEQQKGEIERLRNQQFGGRAVRAEMDALQRERAALEAERQKIRADVQNEMKSAFESQHNAMVKLFNNWMEADQVADDIRQIAQFIETDNLIWEETSAFEALDIKVPSPKIESELASRLMRAVERRTEIAGKMTYDLIAEVEKAEGKPILEIEGLKETVLDPRNMKRV